MLRDLHDGGAPAFAVVVAAIAWVGAIWPADPAAIGLASAVGSGILYYGLAYWLYLWALRRMPPSIAAASFYLIPVFGLLGSYALLGEGLTRSNRSEERSCWLRFSGSPASPGA